MTVAQLIERLKLLPQDAIVAYIGAHDIDPSIIEDLGVAPAWFAASCRLWPGAVVVQVE